MDSQQKKSFVHRYFAFIQRRSIGEQLVFHSVLLAVCAGFFLALTTANALFLTSVPTSGGTLVEGIVGTPRFVNPVLAITRTDHDMVALIYSGLMKLNEDGELVNDIAQSIELSEDGRTYHIVLRDDVSFHNGQKLTARDVSYTITLMQNQDLKSPLRGNWEGVLVEELGDYEMNIVLQEPYAPFIENFTVGILPRDIWDTLPIEQIPFSQHNTEPIGTGPYMVDEVLRNKSGLINAYKLRAFDTASGDPNITTLVFNFYQNEDAVLAALQNKEIASTPSVSAERLPEVDTNTYAVIETVLPRTFALYFNQNRSIALRDASVREALDVAIDKEQLIAQALNGYGVAIDSPVPPGFLPEFEKEEVAATRRPETILVNGGWLKGDSGYWEKEIDGEVQQLSLSITTSNTPLFRAVAAYVEESWKAIGIDVHVDQFEQTDLVQGIIRPRDFQILLFGADVGRTVDLYPFWHSSQKDDPGLNVSRYTNIDADAYLEDIRVQTDIQERATAIRKLETLIIDDKPAVFLFAPTFGYVLDKNVTHAPITHLSQIDERFANIAQWHIQSDAVWPIFSNE